MVKLTVPWHWCQRQPESLSKSIQYTSLRTYADAVPPMNAIHQAPLSRTARSRIQGVAAVQNLNSDRQQPRSEVEQQKPRSPNIGQGSPHTAFRSINLNQSRGSGSPSGPSGPSVLDLRSFGAAPRPGTTGRPLTSRVRGPTRGSPGRRTLGPRRGGPGRRGPPRRRQGEVTTGEEEVVKGDQMTKAEEEYEAAKLAAASALKPTVIDDPTPESLLAFAPRMPLGSFGALAMVDSTLRSAAKIEMDASRTEGKRTSEMANHLLKGEFVYFRSEEEKDAVLKLAHRRKFGKRGEGEKLPIEGLSDGEKKEVIKDLFEGKYDVLVDPSRTGLLQDILRQTRRNGTYFEKNEEALIKKLGPMMPAPKREGRARGGK